MTTDTGGRVLVSVDSDLADLVPRYLANRLRDVETMTAALDRGDFGLIGDIGHNFRGSGCSFGLDELSAIGVDIERAVQAADRTEIARQLRRTREYLSRVDISGGIYARLAGPDAAGAEDGEAIDVLLVDDQEINTVIVGRFLRREGYKVRSVMSGDAALAVLAVPPLPRLILLDVVMNGTDGIEICRQIKSDPLTCGVPVMLVTGAGSTRDRIRGWAAGADDFFSKPVRREELVERVQSLLQGREESAAAAVEAGEPFPGTLDGLPDPDATGLAPG